MIVAKIRLQNGAIITMDQRYAWRGTSDYYWRKIQALGSVDDFPTYYDRDMYVADVAKALKGEILEIVQAVPQTGNSNKLY